MAGGNTETNSTQGMMMDLMKQGLENMTQGEMKNLQVLKDMVSCSPAKMVKNMMK